MFRIVFLHFCAAMENNTRPVVAVGVKVSVRYEYIKDLCHKMWLTKRVPPSAILQIILVFLNFHI